MSVSMRKHKNIKVMRIVQSSFFRALCAVIIGALLIKYREQTVTWMTIVIGVMFFLSGVVSCAAYLSARSREDMPQVFDAQGRQLTGMKPHFPIVGIGSLVLGLILALMPATFITWLMYILAAILILGAINQFVSLASVSRVVHVGFYFWIMPSIIMLIGIIAVAYPSAIASAPLFVIGWCMMLYGVVEIINNLKINGIRRQMDEAAKKTEEAGQDTEDAGQDNAAAAKKVEQKADEAKKEQDGTLQRLVKQRIWNDCLKRLFETTIKDNGGNSLCVKYKQKRGQRIVSIVSFGL